jgi:hypothetical protein
MRPSITDLRAAFSYDPLTGVITRIGGYRNIGLGNTGFVVDERGYIAFRYRGRKIYSHHIAWALHHGAWPERGIDHENQNKADNRIANLRLATQAENVRNKGLTKANTTGFKGVEQLPSGKWRAHLRAAGKRLRFGPFETAEEAARSYDVAAHREHGSFARLNFPR